MAGRSNRRYTSTKARNLANNHTPLWLGAWRRRYYRNKRKSKNRKIKRQKKRFIESVIILSIIPGIFLILYLIFTLCTK